MWLRCVVAIGPGCGYCGCDAVVVAWLLRSMITKDTGVNAYYCISINDEKSQIYSLFTRDYSPRLLIPVSPELYQLSVGPIFFITELSLRTIFKDFKDR